jgi:hypothetical protein
MDSEERRIHMSNTVSPVSRFPARDSSPKTGSRLGMAFSQRTSSLAISFFTLPREIRNDIYRRVLVVAHPLFLFQDTGSRVETFAPDRPFRWPALLYTNRQVHDEASAVLYGLNHFTFEVEMQHQFGPLQSFLNCIGPVNAGLLSHLSINFPVAESVEGQPGKVTLREDDLRSLKLLQEKCTHLTTLETLVYSQNSRRLINASHDDSQFIREALSQINAQLKAISTLREIIVKFNDGHPTPSVMELMQDLGWVVLPAR